MALRKVRNNLDRLFDKNLTDLIRGIRNNKENEVRKVIIFKKKIVYKVNCNCFKARYIAACMEEIKVELRQESPFIKANAIEKLAYVSILFVCIQILEKDNCNLKEK